MRDEGFGGGGEREGIVEERFRRGRKMLGEP